MKTKAIKMVKALAALFAFAFAGAAMAETWEDPGTGITWTYSVINTYQTGWQDMIAIGDGANPAIPTDTAGAVVIPAEIDGKPIYSIENGALSNCTAMTSVSIPATTKHIRGMAFRYCTSLKFVTFPASVADLGEYCFANCTALEGARILGDSLSLGGGDVFRYCSSLKCFIFPTNTTSISYGSFDFCSSLESIYIPKTMVNAYGNPLSDSALKTVYIDEDDAEERVRDFIQTKGGKNPEGITFVKGVPRLVDFDANGGTLTNSMVRIVLDGAAVGELHEPFRSGYLFDGWFTAADGGDQISAETVVSAGVTYYAHWSVKPLPASCTVTFNPNGGDLPDGASPRVVTGGEAIGALPVPEYEGYRFDGWFTLADGGDQISAETLMLDEEAEYFAHWTQMHTVTLNPSYTATAVGQVDPATIKVAHGEAVGDLPAAHLDGYTFICWKNSSSQKVNPSTKIWSDQTWTAYYLPGVYAKWLDPVTGIEWGYCISGNQAILGNIDANGDRVSVIPADTQGDITIPSELGGKPVTRVENYAFRYCSQLTSVTIPDGVTSIGTESFRDCNSLTNVTIPASVTSIYTDAFRGCTLLADDDGFIILKDILFQYLGDDAEVEIPDGVKIIGNNSFYYKPNLTGVTIPGSVTNIDMSAFVSCTALGDVTVPLGVERIGMYAFNWCSSLTNITISASVETIGQDAFKNTALATVMVSKGDTDRVRALVSGAGYNVMGVAFIEEDPWTVTFDANGGTVDPETRPVGNGAKVGPIPDATREGWNFNGWWTEKEGGVSVSAETTITGDVTFYAHWIRVYHQVAFNANGGAAGIDPVQIAYGDPIGELPVPVNGDIPFLGWFTAATGGTPVTTGTVVTAAFTCYAHWLPEGYSIYTDDAGVKWVYSVVNDGGNDVVYVGDGLNAAVASDTEGDIAVPAEIGDLPVVRVSNGAFRGFAAITGVTVPAGVTYLGENAFRDCASLAGFEIPEGVTSIGATAFDGCTSLTSVVIPDGVGSIAWATFRNCTNLVSVAIPPSVQTIDAAAFAGTALAEVHVAIDDTERVSGLIAGSGFDVTGLKFVEDIAVPCTVTFDPNGGSIDDADATRIVNKKDAVGELPEATLEGYALVGWFTEPEGSEQISSETVITSNVTYYAHWTYPTETVDGVTWMYHIVDGGAEICSPAAWTSAISTNTEGAVAIPATLGGYPVTSIGSNAFIHCKLVTNVEIPESVSTIGYYAFAACGLTDVVIPANVTDLATCAFRQCKSLTNVTMSAGLKVIGNYAFEYCDKLEQVVLPEGLERIESGAFYCCEGLASVSVPDSVTYIGPRAFCECFALADENDMVIVNDILFDFSRDAQHNLTSVTIPGTVKAISDYAGRDFDKLEDLTISDGVTSIGVGGFTKCPLLSTLTVPASLTSIGTDAFKNTALATVHYLGSDAEKDRVSAMLAASGYDVSGVEFVCDWDPATIAINTADEYTADDDGSFDLALGALILSKDPPTVTLKGLPAGIKYTTSTGILAGKATKPGSYTVTVSAKSKSVKTPVTKDFTLVVPNFKDATIPVADSYREMVPGVGYTVTIPEAADCKVTGLPAGMKWTAKAVKDKTYGDVPANTAYGAPTKPGIYTVYFTKTTKEVVSGKTVSVKHTATSTFTVGPFPVLTVDFDGDGTGKVTGAGAYAANKKVTLKATADTKDAAATATKPATVKSVFGGWYDGDELLSLAASYSYEMPATDKTLYAKFITAEEDAANIALKVDGVEMAAAKSYETNVMCGVYFEWPVAVDAWSLATVKVAGLPAGLKFTDKPITSKIGTGAAAVVVTNVPAFTIYGAPTAASKWSASTGLYTPSQVKVTVTTAGKTKVDYAIALTVEQMNPTWAVGTFNGGEDDCQATLTVSANGKVSGKLFEGGNTWTLSAPYFDSFEGNVYTATITAKLGQNTFAWKLALDSAQGGHAVLFDDEDGNGKYLEEEIVATMLRTDWKAAPWKTIAGKFPKNAQVEYAAKDDDDHDGTVTLKIAASGAVTTKGVFNMGKGANGREVTYSASGSAVLVPITEPAEGTGAFTAAVWVYFPPKKDKFSGYVEMIGIGWDGAEFKKVLLP